MPLAQTLRAPAVHPGGGGGLLDRADVSLDRIERVVRITTADDPAALLACPVIVEFSRTAPGIGVISVRR